MGGTVLTLLSGLATTHSTAAAIIRDAGLSGMAMISSPTTLTVPGKALARSRLIRILRIAGPSRANIMPPSLFDPAAAKVIDSAPCNPNGGLPFMEARLLEDAAIYPPEPVIKKSEVLLDVGEFTQAYKEAWARIRGHQKN